MEFLLGASLLSVSANAVQVLTEGIAGNEAHEFFRPMREQIVRRLKDGGIELPENHDFRRALEDSLVTRHDSWRIASQYSTLLRTLL